MKTAWKLAYLFPIVRGYLITYQPQDPKTSTELRYALAVALLYSLILVLIKLLPDLARKWLSALTQLFLITLQLFYTAETLELQESAMLHQNYRNECIAGMRLSKLRAVGIVLLVQFMKWIFEILAMMDMSRMYEECGEMTVDCLYIAIDLAINSFAIRQVWPTKKGEEEGGGRGSRFAQI